MLSQAARHASAPLRTAAALLLAASLVQAWHGGRHNQYEEMATKGFCQDSQGQFFNTLRCPGLGTKSGSFPATCQDTCDAIPACIGITVIPTSTDCYLNGEGLKSTDKAEAELYSGVGGWEYTGHSAGRGVIAGTNGVSNTVCYNKTAACVAAKGGDCDVTTTTTTTTTTATNTTATTTNTTTATVTTNTTATNTTNTTTITETTAAVNTTATAAAAVTVAVTTTAAVNTTAPAAVTAAANTTAAVNTTHAAHVATMDPKMMTFTYDVDCAVVDNATIAKACAAVTNMTTTQHPSVTFSGCTGSCG